LFKAAFGQLFAFDRFDVQKEFGKKGQVKVKAYFDGFEYRGSLVKMGHHCHIIGLNNKIRGAINKTAGDIVNILIIEDTEVRKVEMPADLTMELAQNKEAGAVFEKLSYTQRKENIEWIMSAKKLKHGLQE